MLEAFNFIAVVTAGTCAVFAIVGTRRSLATDAGTIASRWLWGPGYAGLALSLLYWSMGNG